MADEPSSINRIDAPNPQYPQDPPEVAMMKTMIVMTLSGFVMSIVYYFYGVAYEYIRRKMVCSIQINSSDDVYKMVLNYLTQKGFLQGSLTQMKCQLKKKKFSWWNISQKEENAKPEVEYLPGPGNHFFTYQGRKMWAETREGDTLITGYERKPTKQEQLVITCAGSDTRPLRALVQDAIDFSQEKESNLLKIYQVHRWGDMWEECQQKRPREMQSVILDSNIAETIVADIKRFMESGDWYISKGVPYRRGYLLYGPPGTGKTSFTQAVASALNLNICYLNLSGGNLDDDGLNVLLNNAPLRSIILLEDIDAIFVERTSVQQQQQQGRSVTFSGLLNALDGVRSQEGRILMMTTNHKEKLDPALLRPGRADVHVELNYASEKQMKGLFKKFFPDSSEEEQQAFANELPEFKLGMAKLQGHFLKYRDDPKGAIANAKSLLDMDYQIKDMSIGEWLRRLNMHQYTPKFRKDGIKRVSDLKYLGEGDLMTWGMEALNDRKRVMSMIQGNEDAKSMFALQNRSQARTIIAQFLPLPQDMSSPAYKEVAQEIEEILDIIGEEQITGYQLRDIFDENKSLPIVKRKLAHKVSTNIMLEKSMSKDLEKDEDEDEKKKKEGGPKDIPDVNIEAMLKSLGLAECIPKLKEHEIAEPEMYFELDADTLVGLLDIKTEGKKFRFKEKMKEVKEKHEKAKAKKEATEDLEILPEKFELLQKKSTIIF